MSPITRFAAATVPTYGTLPPEAPQAQGEHRRVPLAASAIGRNNVFDQAARRWVHPAVNLAHRPSHPTRRIYNDDDSARRDLLVLGTQLVLGGLPAVAAADNLFDTAISAFHPQPGVNLGAGVGYAALATLGFTVGGAYVGAHVAAPFIHSKRRFADVLRGHRQVADAGGYAMACLAGTSVFVVGVGLLAVADERRPDRDKSPTPLWVRDTSVTLIALGYGIYVSAFAGWYLGRVTGAGVARACARWRDEQGSGAASP